MMAERKQFKTRLCVLYQRGRCARHNCSFAHGNAELRRFSGSYSGRRDHLGNDLRDKLDRRHLSPRRYSPARDARGRQTIREYSPPRSPEKRSDRRHRRNQDTTDHSDIAGSWKVSESVHDQVKEGKLISSGSKNSLEEQLKKVHSDINALENRKFELGEHFEKSALPFLHIVSDIKSALRNLTKDAFQGGRNPFAVYLDESVQEVDSLNSRIQELEAQLNKENEECKRITSRIRKFARMHNHNSQLQDELKRSQVRLQRFGDQLVSDISRIGANEEDLSVDIVSNGENTGHPPITKHNLELSDASPRRKRLHVEQDAVEELKQVYEEKSKVGPLVETARSGKRSRGSLSAQSKDKAYEGLETPSNGTEVTRPLDLDGKHKKGMWNSSNNVHSEKLKESRIEVPSTSMAAHVFDEEVEIEHDIGFDINETAKPEDENGVAFQVRGIPLMLPPGLIPRSNYSQYEGKDENVDVDGFDEAAAGAHVDIV